MTIGLTQVSEPVAIVRSNVWPTALGLAVAFVFGVLVLRHLPETPRQGVLAVDTLSERTEVLLLGSSHVYTDVDPRRVGRPWVNLAGGMLSYELAESVLAAHADRLPHLRAIPLEADPVMVTVDSLATYHGDHRPFLDLKPDLSVLQVDSGTRLGLWRDRVLGYDLPIRRVFQREKLDADRLRALLAGERHDGVLPGFEAHEGTSSEGLRGDERIRMHERASPSAAASKTRNLAALTRMLQHAQKLGVPVILVRLPHHGSYAAARPPAFAAAFDELLRTARAAMPSSESLVLLDFEQQPGFGDGEFYDADHLNVAGSARFSALLAQEVDAVLAGRHLATRARALP